ncbi:MAG TPA: lactonase family protein [Pseudosphingobacterium sp.]|nr:lactonase family protein [Pseudosphingobacterium sp.]
MRLKLAFRLILCMLSLPMLLRAQNNTINLLIGTYTNTGKSEGIYVYSFDTTSGHLTYKNKATAENPSYLAISPNKKYVYAVNELHGGKGSLSAFSYNRDNGNLVLINKQSTSGDDPCHVVNDKNGQHLLVSNYSGGSFTVFGTKKNGQLTDKLQLNMHEGSGPDKSRQEKPHVHSATFSPDQKFVLVQDLGTDCISIYPYESEKLTTPVNVSEVKIAKASPGSGPRHIVFSKDGRFVYLVQEMKAAVSVYTYKDGVMTFLQEISMIPQSFNGEVGAADIHIAPDGKFLYASNRGDANDIAIYKVNTSDGKLTHVKNQSVKGKGPRNFTLSPNGKYLLVANQYTNDVVVFERDEISGLLKDTQNRIEVGAPVCLVFDK